MSASVKRFSVFRMPDVPLVTCKLIIVEYGTSGFHVIAFCAKCKLNNARNRNYVSCHVHSLHAHIKGNLNNQRLLALSLIVLHSKLRLTQAYSNNLASLSFILLTPEGTVLYRQGSSFNPCIWLRPFAKAFS